MCIKNLVSIKLVSYTQSCLYLRKVCQYFNWFYKQPLIWLNFFVRFSKLRKLWAGTNGFTNSASPADSVPTPWINLQWWKDQILRSTARHVILKSGILHCPWIHILLRGTVRDPPEMTSHKFDTIPTSSLEIKILSLF